MQCFYRKNQIAMLLILAHFIFQIQAQTSATCNKFPIFFGGNDDDSYLRHIDVFNDYLALVGETYDRNLTGSLNRQRYPYIGLASIATTGKYYWAKALDKVGSVSIFGVQFSEDGTFLIAHSGQAAENFIIVFEVANGNIKSVRKYSTSTAYVNYNYAVKSMVVSSGTSPMAYVSSNYQSSSACTGQHFFKFDPLQFSTAPVWIKQTLGTTNCGHLGLVFGRNEGSLYAFSTYNGYGTVSFVDLNGNAVWQYATPDGNYNSNQIQYKAVDDSIDMILATSGYGFINYNRIISSTASPYSVSAQSQAYRDPNANINLSTRALYIINKDNAKSLILNTQDKWTDLASINFAALTITYKRALPRISSSYLTPGFFVSDTLFYVGSYQYEFYKNNAYSNYIGQGFTDYGVVYTSDQTMTQCYTMSPDAARTPVAMVTIPVNYLASTIYTTSSVAFVNFTSGYSSIDIIKSGLIKVSWCPQSPYSIISVTQATQTFTLNVNVAEQTLPINPFQATLICGTLANTFTYSGFDNTTGLALSSYASDLIAVDSTTGSIKVAQAKPAGSYYVKVVGTLPDLSKTQYVFNITINQSPLKFTTALSNVEVPLMSTASYIFPDITGNDPVYTGTVSLVKDSASGLLPSFITLNTGSLTIAPVLMTDVKVYTMIVVLTDTIITADYYFVLNVTNQAPVLKTQILTPVIATFGQNLIYTLPTSNDPEGLAYTTTLLSGPPYATLLSPTILNINPTNCSEDFGDRIVTIMLKDEEPKNLTYSFTIRVINLPPAFTGVLPQDQIIALNSVLNYTLPPFSDPEGCPMNVTFSPSTLSSFVQISTNVLKFAPTQYTQVGSATVNVVLTDLYGIQSKTSFKVNVTNQAPQVTTTIPTEVDALFQQSINYTLPTSMDPEGLPYTTTLVSAPLYVTLLSQTLLTIYPINCSMDFGDQIVTIMLKDEEPKNLTYSFTIRVKNMPPAFTGILPQDQTVALNSVLNYTLPSFSDPEGCPVSVTFSPSNLSSFVSISTNVIKFAPTQYAQVGSTTVTVVLTDLFGMQQNASFILEVTNQAPKVATTIPTDLVASFGKSIDYILPTSMDPEGLPYNTTIQTDASYVSLLSSTKIRIFPTNCSLDFGTRTITIKLEDGQPLCFTYSFNIKVENLPPTFQAAPLNQSIQLNTNHTYFLPTINDTEGCPVTVSYTTTRPSTFLSVNGTKMTFSPNETSQLGNYNITVTLTDSQGLTTSSTFGFTVFQLPKFTTSVMSKLELFAGNQLSYKLPVVPGVTDEYVVHTTIMPSFVNFTFPDYTFRPNTIADLGPHSITGQLWNSYAKISYQITLNVTNEAPYLNETIPNKFIIAVDTLDSYYLSKVLDRENHTITFLAREVKKTRLPPFVTLDLDNPQYAFVFQPTKLDTQPLYQIQLDIMDSFGGSTSYFFNITIYNPPILIQTTKQQASNSSSSSSASQTAQNINLAILSQKKQFEVQMYRVGFEIVKVTRNQQATLKLYCEENSKIPIQDIVLRFSIKTIEVAVVVSQRNISYKIPTQIISKDLSSSQILLRLKYPNLSNISTSQVPDQLSIRIENRIQVLKKQIQTILKEDLEDMSDIPPQVAQGNIKRRLNQISL